MKSGLLLNPLPLWERVAKPSLARLSRVRGNHEIAKAPSPASQPAAARYPLPRGGEGKKGLRRLRQRGLGLGEGPVEPGQKRLDVAGLNRGAAPDAQTRRR